MSLYPAGYHGLRKQLPVDPGDAFLTYVCCCGEVVQRRRCAARIQRDQSRCRYPAQGEGMYCRLHQEQGL